MRPSERDSSKLPKWAQTKIEVLEKDVEWHRRRLAEALGGPEDSNTYIDTYTDINERKLNLPNDSRVVFRLPNGHQLEARLYHDGTYVELRSTGLMSGSLEVQPQASNSAKVRIGGHW